jgi:predicted transcriptional regulator
LRTNIENKVTDFFHLHKEATRKDLGDYISQVEPAYTPATISTYITKLVNKGIIFRNGRGNYTYTEKNDYKPQVSQRLKLIAGKIKQDFPLLNFCVWDSNWLNEFMRHQLFRQMLVIEVEKDGAESVFYALGETNKKLFYKPDAIVFERYISGYDDPIIIMPLISESPISEAGKIPIPTLEKLLVDMVADKNLYAAQQAELDFIYENALAKYAISISKIKRYARRRNQFEKTMQLLTLAEKDIQLKTK